MSVVCCSLFTSLWVTHTHILTHTNFHLQKAMWSSLKMYKGYRGWVDITYCTNHKLKSFWWSLDTLFPWALPFSFTMDAVPSFASQLLNCKSSILSGPPNFLCKTIWFYFRFSSSICITKYIAFHNWQHLPLLKMNGNL